MQNNQRQQSEDQQKTLGLDAQNKFGRGLQSWNFATAATNSKNAHRLNSSQATSQNGQSDVVSAYDSSRHGLWSQNEPIRKKSIRPNKSLGGDEEDLTRFKMNKHPYSTFMFGNTQSGQLGIGFTTQKAIGVPMKIDLQVQLVKITCGAGHSVALSENGRLYSWGLNVLG